MGVENNKQNNQYDFLWKPYVIGAKCIKQAFFPKESSISVTFGGRVFCLVKGLTFMTPILNNILFVAIRAFKEKRLENRMKGLEKQEEARTCRGVVISQPHRRHPLPAVPSEGPKDSPSVRELSHATTVSPPTRQERRIPPVSIFDTVRPIVLGEKLVSIHGEGHYITDREIVECEAIVRQEKLQHEDLSVSVGYTKYGKPIIQQQSTRGCTAATAAMLIMDHHKQPNLLGLRSRNFGDDEYILRDIKGAGLVPLQTSVNGLDELRKCLLSHGSAIVSVGGSIGSHSIVVDEVSEESNNVRIREPYHGWEITISAKTFLSTWGPEDILIQVDTTPK